MEPTYVIQDIRHEWISNQLKVVLYLQTLPDRTKCSDTTATLEKVSSACEIQNVPVKLRASKEDVIHT